MSNLQTSKHQYQSSSSKRDFSLFYSILVHLLLACGLYYISQPKIPKETPNLEAMIVTPEMLKSMQAEAKSASDGAEAISVKNRTGSGKNKPKPKDTLKTTPKNDMSLEELNNKLAAPKAKNAILEKKLINKTTREEIKPETPPKEKSIFKPKATKKTEVKKDKVDKPKETPKNKQNSKADKMLEQNKKNREAFEKKKRQAEREKKAFLKKQRQEAERREKQRENKLKKERKAEKERLKELKAKERQQAKRQEERRQKIARERAKAEEKRKAEAAANAKKQSSGTASLDGGKSTGSKKSDKPKQNSGPSKADIKAAQARYIGLIKSKVKSNWSKATSDRVTVPVKIKLSSSGKVLSVRVNKAGIDPALKQSIESAVRKSSPLPVPKDPELFKPFKSFTFNFRTQ